MRRAHPLVRQEAVLAREPEDAAAAGTDAREAQPRPQLAVALAVEGAGGQELPDLLDQAIVRHRAERPRSPGGGFARSVPMAVDGRPRHAPQARDPLDPVHLIRGGRDPAAHRLDLRRTKGRAVSSRPILASSSSVVMVRSPTFSLRRPISASRASAGRLLREASPAARNCSRQPLSSAAAPPSSRETSSRSPPRSNLSPAPRLRPADIRRRGSGVGPSPPAWRARSAGPTPTPAASSILHLLAAAYLQSGVSANCRPGDTRQPMPEVGVEDPVDPLPGDPGGERVQRVVLTTPGSEPVAEAEELRLGDRRQDGHHRGLDDLVFQRRDAERPSSAVRLRDVPPPWRQRPVGAAVETVVEIGEPGLQVDRVLLPGQAIDSRRRVPPLLEEGPT